MPGETIRLVGPDGTIEVPIDQAASALGRGYTVETDAGSFDRLSGDAREETYGGVKGKVGAFVTRGLGAATLGLSDVAIDQLGGSEYSKALADVNPGAALAGTIAGSLVPLIPGGGATRAGVELGELGTGVVRTSRAAEASLGSKILAASPAAITGRIGSKIAGLGEGAGLVGRTAATAAGGAFEGAAQNAGAYISDVALGDRKLSADGFVGAMGQGAFWGGVSSGALSLSSEGLTAARRLFPGAEMTADATRSARWDAINEIQKSLDDSSHMASKAESELTAMRAQEELVNPTFRQQAQEIRLRAQQDLADAKVATARAQQTVAEARATKEQAVTQARLAKLEEAAARKGKPRAKKAGEPAEAPEPVETETAPTPEPARAPVNDNSPELLDALNGTKAKLDGGATLREVGASHVDDALNAALADVNPAAAAIYKPLKAARASSEEMTAWLERYGGDSAVAFDASSAAVKKQKIADWAKNANPKDVEGELAAAHFQGDPENMKVRLGAGVPDHVRQAANEAGAEAAHRAYLDATAEAANVSASGTELMARSQYASKRAAAKAQDEVHTAFQRGELRAPTGDEIVAAQTPPAAKIDKALGHKAPDVNDDIAETAAMFTKHEAAHADLADALGPSAPTSSQAQAQNFRGAQRASADKAATQAAAAADAIAQAPAGIGRTLLDHAKDAGSAYEALRLMGVPLPDPHNVPVIGPLLSVYLKSKVISKAFGRFGGKVPATSETTIAAKSAAIRQRSYAVADAMLSVASKATKAAAVVSGGPAAALGHTLFSHDEEKKPYSSKPQEGKLGDLYVKRADEVNAAMQPGAIAASIRKKIQTSDPDALQEIIEAQTRKMTVISDAMPKPATPPTPLEGRVWLPSKTDLIQWSKIVRAVDDPAGTFERAAQGNASVEEIKAVAKVYPSLYADVQKRVIAKLADENVVLPFAQRQALSRTWGLPLDSSVQPDHAAFLQAGYQPAPAAPQPVAPMGQPTIAGPIGLGERMMTRI